jgi:hypothetical protein
MSEETPKRKSSRSAIRSSVAWKGFTPVKGLRVVVRSERVNNGGPNKEAGEIAAVNDVEGAKYYSIRFDWSDKAGRPVSHATLLHFYYPEPFWKGLLRDRQAAEAKTATPNTDARPQAARTADEGVWGQSTSAADSAAVKGVDKLVDAIEKLTRAAWALESTMRAVDKSVVSLDANCGAALVAHGKSIQDSALQVATSLDEAKGFAAEKKT